MSKFKKAPKETKTTTIETSPPKVLYELQPKQESFMLADGKYTLMGGAKGGGKSYGCRAKIVKACMEIDGFRMLALRRSMPEIEENMIEPMIKEINGPLKGKFEYKSSKHRIQFANGSSVRFSYCENMKHVRRYQGLQYDGICIEELTQWREEEWRILMNCLRTSRKGIRPVFFGSCNPGDIGHGWVKRLFINREYTEHERPDDYVMIRSFLSDNVHNDAEYVQNLMNLPEKQRRAYLDGDWDVFEGQYFTEWRRDIHVVRPFIPINGVKRRIICLDYGFSPHPSAVYWLAQMNSNHVICYRELYETRLRFDQLAARIAAMTTEDEEISVVVADPSVVSKEKDDGNTFEDEFNALGYTVIGGKNERIEGWNLVRKYLSPYEDPNSGRLIAKLSVTENCTNLIRTIPEMVHDTVRVEDMNTKGEDHPSDSIRYGLMEIGDNILTSIGVGDLNEPLKRKSLATQKGENPRLDASRKEEYYRRQYGDSDSGHDDLLSIRF